MIFSNFELNGITAVYYRIGDIFSLMLVPTGTEDGIRESKLALIDPMIQLCVNGEAAGVGYISGESYHNASYLLELRFVRQYEETYMAEKTVITEFEGKNGVFCRHFLKSGRRYVRSYVTVENRGNSPFDIYDLASFSLNGITPFSDGPAYGKLKLHTFRSFWSAEGRHCKESLEDLNFEPGWTGWSCKTLKISQTGTMPVRGHFPFMALEDTEAGVTWAAETEHCGSWQIEMFRQKDNVVMTGGLGNYLSAQWIKTLDHGEAITSPEAILTAVKGGIDEACSAILNAHEDALTVIGGGEEELCPLYNEYCDTWNHPNNDTVSTELDAIKDFPFGYFVIDAGWNGRSDLFCTFNNGDWITCKDRFPQGMRYIADQIKSRGMTPGLWFEPECASVVSRYYNEHKDDFIKLNGFPVIHTDRAFFDMSSDCARRFMKENVIDFLKSNGFGYIKIDYNDHIGIGFDGYESIGEANRRSALGTYQFFEDMRREIPELIIENCASGGHRLEPGMMRRSSMSSFSDAHECVDIPLIAADLQRLILPRQSQIWAVIRKDDSPRRIVYSCVNTLLGRMCVSGNVAQLDEKQHRILGDGILFYTHAAPVIKKGISRCVREGVSAYREPTGWQAVIRRNEECGVLVALNVFSVGEEPFTVKLRFPELKNRIIREFYAEDGCNAVIHDDELEITVNGSFSGAGILLD